VSSPPPHEHVVFAVADSERSKPFYEKALEPLGMTLLMEFSEAAAGFRKDGGERPSFFIEAHREPVRGRLHIALRAETRAQVDAFYAAAIEAGEATTGAHLELSPLFVGVRSCAGHAASRPFLLFRARNCHRGGSRGCR
jgi:catechol 2,3-dioxygenase-like lactoylglutathione lyase family enzyme